MRIAMQESHSATASLVPDNSVLLISSDSDAMRRAFDTTCIGSKSSRQEARTPEMGELRAAGYAVDAFNARGVDAVSTWEAAYHDRPKRGTADGRILHRTPGMVTLQQLRRGC